VTVAVVMAEAMVAGTTVEVRVARVRAAVEVPVGWEESMALEED